MCLIALKSATEETKLKALLLPYEYAPRFLPLPFLPLKRAHTHADTLISHTHCIHYTSTHYTPTQALSIPSSYSTGAQTDSFCLALILPRSSQTLSTCTGTHTHTRFQELRMYMETEILPIP